VHFGSRSHYREREWIRGKIPTSGNHFRRNRFCRNSQHVVDRPTSSRCNRREHFRTRRSGATVLLAILILLLVIKWFFHRVGLTGFRFITTARKKYPRMMDNKTANSEPVNLPDGCCVRGHEIFGSLSNGARVSLTTRRASSSVVSARTRWVGCAIMSRLGMPRLFH
jgi:hypothetical protein